MRVLLLSTADTELLAAHTAGGYVTANPSRIDLTDLDALCDGVDVVVVRLLGGLKAWREGIADLRRRGLPLVALGGEAAPDAELMVLSTVPAGVAAEALAYLREGGVANLRELARFLSDTVLLTGEGFEPPRAMPAYGLHRLPGRRAEPPTAPARGPDASAVPVRFRDASAAPMPDTPAASAPSPDAQAVPARSPDAAAVPAPSPDAVARAAEPAMGRPTVAVVFYRAHELSGNTAFVDTLCEHVAALGAEPLPVFCGSLRSVDDGLLDLLRRADTVILTVLAAGGASGGRVNGADGSGRAAGAASGARGPIADAGAAGREASATGGTGPGGLATAAPDGAGPAVRIGAGVDGDAGVDKPVDGDAGAGKPVADAGQPVGGDEVDDGWDAGALAGLDVPLVQGLCLTTSRATWERSDAALSPMDAAMQVAIPEFDGRVISVPFSFKEDGPDGVPVYAADPERAARVAGIAVRLARLRHTPVAERRLAIVLSSYPTKHSRIGNAVGLDTPVSAVRLLAALRAAGYTVGEYPEDGDELIHSLIAAGGHDVEWLTEEQLRAASARVPAKAYEEWFEALPEPLRAAVREHWGEPPGELYVDATGGGGDRPGDRGAGPASAHLDATARDAAGRDGAVRDGTGGGDGTGRDGTTARAAWADVDGPGGPAGHGARAGRPGRGRRGGPVEPDIVLATLRFGNVLLMIQPPRGFGENPVAIYHDPDLPPSHHYLAAYRWLDEVFGAHAVIHLGKHGTLEWLPGKGLGLSAECAPDAVLGDLPLVYPFIVNDPGEGTQAKRRGHAVIVDHMVPPMARADTYGDLAKLEQLLDEYATVQALDPAKLPAVRAQIWTLVQAAQLNHDLRVRDQPDAAEFDDFVLHIDGYLCEVKDVQIRDGLHILGQAPEGAPRVDLVLAVLRAAQVWAGRAGALPGLRAAIAAAFGLNERALLADPGTVVGTGAAAVPVHGAEPPGGVPAHGSPADLPRPDTGVDVGAREGVPVTPTRGPRGSARDTDAGHVTECRRTDALRADAETVAASPRTAGPAEPCAAAGVADAGGAATGSGVAYAGRVAGGVGMGARVAHAGHDAGSGVARGGQGAGGVAGLAEIVDGPARTGADVVDLLEAVARRLVVGMETLGWDASRAGDVCGEVIGRTVPEVVRLLEFAAREVVPRLAGTSGEIGAVLHALDGGYVPAGPSGSPTRGLVNVLPTGRNFYSVDPKAIPSRIAWDVGVALADSLIRRHLDDTGEYPRSVGLTVWGTSAMRTQGDDIAEVLALIGVRPTWDEASRRVTGFEVASRAELGRPRVDVTLRISGFFRDAFPHVIALVDDAIQAVAALDEPDNHVRAHALEDAERHGDWRRATSRIFGSKPGAYGAGLLPLIDARTWRDDGDLAEVYAVWGGFAYGRGLDGREARADMEAAFRRISVAAKNQDTREHDIVDSDDYFQYHGGMVAMVRALTGVSPAAYVGDSALPDQVRTRTLDEETRRVFRARVVNPRWIAAMRRHGYKGAFELAATVDYLFGYDATAGVVDDWMYERLAQEYVFDEENRAFMERSNPWALRGIAERLLEAADRGLWAEPAAETLDRLRQTYLDLEGDLEAGG